MKVQLIEDATILIPNKEHKNFTETGSAFKKGSELEGEPVNIMGKRRGEDFTYRLFKTNDNQLIFLNKTDMKNRVVQLNFEGVPTETVKLNFEGVPTEEIKIGFDGVQPIIVDENPNKSIFAKYSSAGVLVGSAVGFGISKYKNMEMKKIVMFTLIGALAGYVVGNQIDKRLKIVVKQSK